jgi:hypothetical protein
VRAVTTAEVTPAGVKNFRDIARVTRMEAATIAKNKVHGGILVSTVPEKLYSLGNRW